MSRPIVLLDVSSYQSDLLDWRRVKAAGVSGVFVKATEGAGYVNPFMRRQATGARAAGLRVGFYHFARPDRSGKSSMSADDARVEAGHFAATTHGHHTRRDLRPVLDFEAWSPRASLSPSQLVTWAREWNAAVRRLLGVGPIFYSYPAFIARLAPSTPIGYGLWLASYSTNDGAEHPYAVPKPWRRTVAHQFTSNGRVPGVPGRVDVSHAPSLRPLLAHPVTGLL